MDQKAMQGIGTIVDSNVHLWDQGDNPVFWLSDRTLLHDMLGDYDSLPDTYTLSHYREETRGFDVRGVIWSDAGAADPLAAADWVSRQQGSVPSILAAVTLGDPGSASFSDLVRGCRLHPLIRSIRIRLVPSLSGRRSAGSILDDRLVQQNMGLLASSDLVATVEATSEQLGTVARLAAEYPTLKIVVDHFGWPSASNGGADRATHMRRLADLAAFGTVATRIDAIGTIFGDWTLAGIRPWLLDVAEIFGPNRCMLGSDLPVEDLRSGFEPLYAAYGEVFSSFSGDERAWLFHRAAEHWYTGALATNPGSP